MSIYLDPTGRSTFGIAICDRCKRKFYTDQLTPDPNAPGLMVCVDDLDVFDPWRLPARPAEKINLPYVRPDEPVDDVNAPAAFTLVGAFLITEDGDLIITEGGSLIEAEVV